MPARRPLLAAALAALGTARPAGAADPWVPARPGRIVVAYPPGGSTDILARLLAEPLGIGLGAGPMVVDNRAGGAAVVGTRAVAQAAPDGLTLALGNNQTHAANAAMLRDLPYRPIEDFAAIGRVAVVHHAVLIPAGAPARSLADLAARPGLVYASSGVGSASHVIAEAFVRRHHVFATHVPYRGGAQALGDTLGGQVDFFVSTWPQALPFVLDGRLRALAVGAPARLAEAPDVPTLAEAGAPELAIDAWFGLWAPAATPAPIVARLDEALGAALEQPELAARLERAGFVPAHLPATGFAAFQAAEVARWRALAALTGIMADAG